RTITAGEEYLPVPTMSREVNVLPAIVKPSVIIPLPSSLWQSLQSAIRNPQSAIRTVQFLPSADEVDDLHRVAFPDDGLREHITLHDDQIVFDRDAPRVDFEPRQQLSHGQRPSDIVAVPVQRNRHGCSADSSRPRRNRRPA